MLQYLLQQSILYIGHMIELYYFPNHLNVYNCYNFFLEKIYSFSCHLLLQHILSTVGVVQSIINAYLGLDVGYEIQKRRFSYCTVTFVLIQNNYRVL